MEMYRPGPWRKISSGSGRSYESHHPVSGYAVNGQPSRNTGRPLHVAEEKSDIPVGGYFTDTPPREMGVIKQYVGNTAVRVGFVLTRDETYDYWRTMPDPLSNQERLDLAAAYRESHIKDEEKQEKNGAN